MVSGSKLLIEAAAGAAAAVAVALIADRVAAVRRSARADCEDHPDGAPHGWRERLMQFLALRIAFRTVMGATRIAATAAAKRA